MGRGQTRDCTNDYRRLDVRALHRCGCLSPGWSGAWQWSRGGERIGLIVIDVAEDHVTLRYKTRERCGEWQDKNYPVRVERTPCHFGGTRAWFRCPACGRRAAILYGGGVFTCRRCRNLAYESQREVPHYRAPSKAQAIHQKLGGTGIVGDFVFKPKGMHWRTFHREMERFREAESRAVPPWLWRGLNLSQGVLRNL
jgi:hypothetical protein